MRICRFFLPGEGARLGAVLGDDVCDLTASGRPEFASLEALLCAWDVLGEGAAEWLAEQAAHQPRLASYRALERPAEATGAYLLRPTDAQEIWAAGVTYYRSRHAREEESHGSGIYDRVYAAARPEIFFKATPNRTAGPFEPVRVRSDSRWCVPEPELALVLTPQLKLAGYTIGNDMSARDIEGENPLYLPQAKIHRGCCALGPCIVLPDEFDIEQPATIACAVYRGGRIAFEGETRTDQMVRLTSELIAYLGRDNEFPSGAVLLTGTGIVPPDSFCLQVGDRVEIRIDRIGALVNPVERC